MTRIVTPFRPFVPEAKEQKEVGPFDWPLAIDMLRESARRSCGLDVVAITDDDTELKPPALQFATFHRRLMPWIIEIALAYIESDAFDQDTIMVSPDILVFGNPGHWFEVGDFDLGLVARHHAQRPLINSVQFWPHARRDQLRRLYAAVFDQIDELSEAELVWGGDTTPFVKLFGPVVPGRVASADGGGRVRFFDLEQVMPAFSERLFRKARPDRLIDFRFRRKLYMRDYFRKAFPPMREVNGWFFAEDDRFMAGELGPAGEYQRSHLDAAIALAKGKRRLAVDGGAHVGTWSVPLAKTFERVIAFEPSEDTYEALVANLARQGVKNVEPKFAALGAGHARGTMALDAREQVRQNLGGRFVTDGDDVPIVPLDSFDLFDLDFLKLDVEGSEVAALLGARETLKRCRPLVLFEDKNNWKRYGQARRAPHELLAKLGARPLLRSGCDEIWGW